MTGSRAGATGNRSAACAPHGVYPASGEDQWVVIQVLTEAQWGALMPDLIAALRSIRWNRGSARAARRTRSRAVGDGRRCARRARSCMQLQGVGVPAAAVYRRGSTSLDDPQLARRRFWQMLRARTSDCSRIRSLLTVSVRSRMPIEAPAPTLGQHNRQVLCELLGLTEQISRG